jgi:hypothetical protein
VGVNVAVTTCTAGDAVKVAVTTRTCGVELEPPHPISREAMDSTSNRAIQVTVARDRSRLRWWHFIVLSFLLRAGVLVRGQLCVSLANHTPRGSVIVPAKAEAATVAGLAR